MTNFFDLVLKTEDGKRKKSADGANGESLEKYKTDNQTLLLQVSLGVFLNAENQI